MTTDKELNKVYFSDMMEGRFPKIYKELTKVLCENGVPFGIIPNTNDIWCRDYMPVQVKKDKYVRFVYNPDYLQETPEDRASISDTRLICEKMGMDVIESDIVLDGGNIVRCGDKVVMIDKVFDENPWRSVSKLSSELENLFEAEIVFLPWDYTGGEVYGHADGLLRYVGHNRVLLTNYRQFDEDFTHRVEKRLKPHFEVVKPLEHKTTSEYSWAYINWLQTDKVLIVPKLGLKCDEDAKKHIESYFEDEIKNGLRVEQVEALALVKAEGVFNCATWTVEE